MPRNNNIQSSCRILGLDPGSRHTGYGVIEKRGVELTFISCGVISTSAKMPFLHRLQEIHAGICEVIKKNQPDMAALEDVFVSVNPRSALKLGHARGVIALAAMQHNLPVHEFTPRLVKQGVVGYGQASKVQVQQMVRVLLKLSSSPSQDAADALAVAICQANNC